MNRIAISAAALAMFAGAALAAPTKTVDGAGGALLTDAKGMTLYTFDKDAGGMSNCAGNCAVNWPILAASASDKAEGDYAVIDRADGTRQWTYKTKPLYTFVKDAAAGDATGDGVNGVWHIARP